MIRKSSELVASLLTLFLPGEVAKGVEDDAYIISENRLESLPEMEVAIAVV